MTSIATRKQARRFFGTMGAAMRRTSRWLDTRQNERADARDPPDTQHFRRTGRCPHGARHLMAS